MAAPGTRRLACLCAALIVLSATGCSVTSTDAPATRSSNAPTIPSTNGPGVTSGTVIIVDDARTDPNSDYARMEDAIAGYYNAHGGIAGRKIMFGKAIAPKTPASATSEQVAQAFCAAASSGPHFFVNIDYDGYSCLSDRGIVTLAETNGDVTGFPASELADPYLIAPSDITYTRLADTLALRLHQDGWLKSAHKVGVLTGPTGTHVGEDDADAITALVTGLKRNNPSYSVQVFPSSYASSAAILNQILQLKNAGIDHVVAAGQADTSSLFMSSYTQQHYYPAIAGIDLLTIPPAIHGVPASMLTQAVSYGIAPTDPAVPRGQRTQLTLDRQGARACARIVQSAHLPVTGDSLGDALNLCQDFTLLKAAVAASGSKFVNAQAVLAGLSKMRNFACPLAFSCAVSAENRDGATAVRRIRYDPALKVFQYVGGDLPTASS